MGKVREVLEAQLISINEKLEMLRAELDQADSNNSRNTLEISKQIEVLEIKHNQLNNFLNNWTAD